MNTETRVLAVRISSADFDRLTQYAKSTRSKKQDLIGGMINRFLDEREVPEVDVDEPTPVNDTQPETFGDMVIAATQKADESVEPYLPSIEEEIVDDIDDDYTPVETVEYVEDFDDADEDDIQYA